MSTLATEAETRSIIEQAGLVIDQWRVTVEESIEWFKKMSAQIKADGAPPISTRLLMGDNAKVKLQNYFRNLSEDRVSVALGTAHKTYRIDKKQRTQGSKYSLLNQIILPQSDRSSSVHPFSPFLTCEVDATRWASDQALLLLF